MDLSLFLSLSSSDFQANEAIAWKVECAEMLDAGLVWNVELGMLQHAIPVKTQIAKLKSKGNSNHKNCACAWELSHSLAVYVVDSDVNECEWMPYLELFQI